LSVDSAPPLGHRRQVDSAPPLSHRRQRALSRRELGGLAIGVGPAAAAAALSLVAGGAAPARAAAGAGGASIAARFEQSVLPEPAVGQGRSELNGVVDLYLPDWMEGRWAVEATLTNFSAPLGAKFLGGPQGRLDIAEVCRARQAAASSSLSSVAASSSLSWVAVPFSNREVRTRFASDLRRAHTTPH
jgi:hypothetical protein